MTTQHHFFATAPKGIEPLLATELRELGAGEVKESRSGVRFSGTIELACRICLWSRLASRVFLPLAEFPAPTPEALYDGARAIPWQEHLDASGTLAVDCSVSSSAITHSRYGALKVKDAVVDLFRDATGVRPSVDTVAPDLRINVWIHRDRATISIDLSGESLHRRGYREQGVEAPLKETLAAAILLFAGWPAIAATGGALVDPMCGSGTLLIEGALMAADIAPGIFRQSFGFSSWPGCDRQAWERLVAEAGERRQAGLLRLPPIVGYDQDPLAVAATTANIVRAGLQDKLSVAQRPVALLARDGGEHWGTGLVAVNPPYGERLGTVKELAVTYEALGSRLKTEFAGWKGAVFTGNPELGRSIGIRARKVRTLFNGPIECRLLHFDIEPERFFGGDRPEGGEERAIPAGSGAEMFANRLRKNLKSIGGWARKSSIGCYRLYDADMPEYAVAIDLYEGWVHVQEYEPPASIDPAKAASRLREVMAVLPEVLGVERERIFLKVRRRQKGTAQYEKLSARGEFHEVREGNCRFLVNFADYLDTGLFLDHRPTRLMLGEMAQGKRFLNLFAYTGTATVHAALGGAASTVSVDMSRTYLEWARRNLALNGAESPRHEFIQADCLQWLGRERRRFDLIFLDPPTFSASKRMEGTFDVQRDQVQLITAAARLLAPDGVLIFSTNNRRFRMDAAALPGLVVEDITRATIPKDFERNPRIHSCWRITRP